MEKPRVKAKRHTLRSARAALRKLLIGSTFIHCVCERMTQGKGPSPLLVQLIEDEASKTAEIFLRAFAINVTVLSHEFPYQARFSNGPPFTIVTSEMITRARYELAQLPAEFWQRLEAVPETEITDTELIVQGKQC